LTNLIETLLTILYANEYNKLDLHASKPMNGVHAASF